jgi:uncharacterized repeat protein (TIGR01451 family)
MCKSFLGLCAALLLSLTAPVAWSAAALPFFQISSMSADDAGGIYNGSIVTLTIVVKNTGSGAGQWQAALTIPSGYSFIGTSPCGGHFFSPATAPGTWLIWPDGTDGNGGGDALAVGASSSCAVQLNVTTATPNDAATATAYRGAFNNGAGTVNGTQTYHFTTTSTPTTDMAIAVGASATSVTVGSTVDYTLTASNVGRQTGTGVRTVFNFPTTLSVVPKNCPGASTLGGNSITWNIGNVNFGASATCVLTATALSGGGSQASVNATISASTTDPNSANNTAANTIAIMAAAPQADLAAAISANAQSLTPGQSVTFTLKATNNGPQSAASAQLTAQFPPQLQLSSASCVSGTPGSSLTWAIGTLAAGASQTCTVQATLNATTVTSITASEAVSSTTADGNSANNGASVSIAVTQPTQGADIAIHLSGPVAGQAYTPGQQLSFIVTATNTSAGVDASGVVATVHFPGDGSLTGFSATCGSVDASGKLVWSIGNLSHNSSMTCNVGATVTTSAHVIAVSASIDAPVLGSDMDHLLDALLVPVNFKPTLISRTVSGAATTKNSTHVALNGDGSVAVFQSQETGLITGNTDVAGQDIYRVGADGKAVLETMDSAGHQLIGTSSLPAISGDGGIIAFAYSPVAAAQAKDAVTSSMWSGPPGQPKHQVDMGTGGAAPNGAASGAPSVTSANGSKKLVFCSAASNLVSGDTNGARDVFLVDPSNPAQVAQLISTDTAGVQLPGDSCEPMISADGTKVVFTVSAPALYHNAFRQVVRKDLNTGALDLISIATVPGGPGANADSSEPSINADGSVIAFTSQASDLDNLGSPVGGEEAYVSMAQSPADSATRSIKRVRSGDGTVPNGSSQHPHLSDDGTILVMQTSATNFFGQAKSLGTPPCGSVAVTTNFFSPAAMASSLCNGSTSNQNPTISGDGTTAGVDSNAPQPGTASNNSNAYTQSMAGLNALGASNLGGDFSGQWYDPNQSGQGLVIDVIHPDANGNRALLLTWFVYVNGQPTWVQGVGTPQTGFGDTAGMVVVQMNPVGIFHGSSFPLGPPGTTVNGAVWGSITLTFADASKGTMKWTSTYPGFNSGTMAITHFLPVGLPVQDAPGAQIKACYSGNWYNPAQSGHGFEFEVIPANPPVLVVDWFAYGPTGAAVWLQGAATITGNITQVPLQLIDGAGAQFPPQYDATQIVQHPWGTATFIFTDSAHASVTWNSTISGYGSGTQPLQPLAVGLLDRRGCQ